MAIERLANPTYQKAATEPGLINAGSIAYKDIQDPQLRSGLRTGDLLVHTALRSELVKVTLLQRGKSADEILGDNDLLELIPNRVIQRIKGVVGVRGAIAVVEDTLGFVATEREKPDERGLLNGDKDLVEAELFKIREDLLGERSLETRTVRISERIRRADNNAKRALVAEYLK